MAFKDIKYKEPLIPHQKYENRLVAFIDILGFSEMVNHTIEDAKNIRCLTAALKSLYDKFWQWEADGTYSSFAFTQFSDSIVISSLAETTDSFEMLQQLLLGVVELVDSYGILVRGGIACGALIHDKVMVVGPAMNEAYYLESKIAKYPRIIIAKELKEQIEVDLAESLLSRTQFTSVPQYCKLFQIDEDGYCYLDYVNPDENYCECAKEEHLMILEQLVQNNLQSTLDQCVKEKYCWLQKKIKGAKII